LLGPNAEDAKMREPADERSPDSYEPEAEAAVPRPRKPDEDTVRIKLSDVPDSDRDGT
jgi:hypothetical protein